MKRCLILMMILGAVLTLSGCEKSYEEDARKTVNQYSAAVKDADLDKAKTYCSPNVDNEFDFDDYKAGFQKQFEALNLSEKTKKQTEEFIDYCIRSSIESYEVGEAEKSEDWDDAYTVPVSIKFRDISDIDIETGQAAANQKLQQYVKDNEDELEKVYTQQGEDAFEKKIMGDTMGIVLGEMKKLINGQKPEERTAEATVIRKDDRWVISKMTAD